MRVGVWERWYRGDDLETSQIGGDEAPPGDIMRRFTIRTLMSAIVVSAIGLAALRNASDLWAGFMLLVALAAVGVAVLGAIILRGRTDVGGWVSPSSAAATSPWCLRLGKARSRAISARRIC
jgi:hypothetical protein